MGASANSQQLLEGTDLFFECNVQVSKCTSFFGEFQIFVFHIIFIFRFQNSLWSLLAFTLSCALAHSECGNTLNVNIEING